MRAAFASSRCRPADRYFRRIAPRTTPPGRVDGSTIRKLVPERLLSYSHFSPLAGQPDKPENYHTVTIELAEQTGQTVVTLTQDNNANEEQRAHSENNWRGMLEGLKRLLER